MLTDKEQLNAERRLGLPKQLRLSMERAANNPPRLSVPRLEKGLSQHDRRSGFTIYMHIGRAQL